MSGPEPAAAPVPRAAAGAAPLVAVLAGIALVVVAIRLAPALVATAVAAGAVYYVFSPLVEWLERRRVPRLAGALLSALVALAVLTLVLVLVVPRAYAQAESLAAEGPEYAERLERWALETDAPGENADARVRDAVHALVERGDDVAIAAVASAARALGGIIGALLGLVLGVVLGFYLLVGAPALSTAAPAWIPPERRDRWVRFGRTASGVLGGYLRARLVASAFVGASYTVAFMLLGLDQAVLLGTVGGVLNVVPIVGPILAGIPALFVALFESWQLALAVLVVMLVAQQVESLLVNPHLEARYVRLPPVMLLVAAGLGAATAGLGGLLLATPVAGIARAALQIFYRERWERIDAHSPREDADPPERDPRAPGDPVGPAPRP